MKTWAVKYDECESCHTTDKPYHAIGLCTTCYHRQYKRKSPAHRTNELERFINALPTLLKNAGIMNYTASYRDGTVTIKRLHSKLYATWRVDD